MNQFQALLEAEMNADDARRAVGAVPKSSGPPVRRPRRVRGGSRPTPRCKPR